ncbi:hypothetical protein LJR290_004668 [Variovorax sp. LjRoot290]|uniref:hypothetical protein n=1 Tax=unclassified Variovorax TaxID=663243 RepID=UPI0008859D59|nr:hypothetical protein [Variovorax sp. CF079]SDE25555.1 hypothetical protein SAMN05444679_119140 [Variovorax sp. CF079]
MSKRSDEIETVPHCLDAWPSRPRAQGDSRPFASTVANFFRRNGSADAPESMVAKVQPFGSASEIVRREQTGAKSNLFKHWDAIRAEGITASQFIAFLQPLADLDGITVSYTYSDEDGTEHVYNHRRGELGSANPLSRAIQEKKLSKEKALTFALNEEGRVWIESNFIELSDLT